MAKQEVDPAEVFLRRKEKNLNFFKRTQPSLYQVYANMMLSRVELVVTPGATDVDMTVNGKSCYRGLAKEYSLDEASQFLQNHPESQKMATFAPPWPESYRHPRMATLSVRELVEKSPITPQNFEGYKRGNVFPSIVFLGCGLGYHIEALVDKATIVNAIIVEKDPEKFAASLFTVDWEKICSKFQRKGYSLRFAIGSGEDAASIRNMLSSNLSQNVPFHPFFTIYYNHLADIELAKTAMDVSKDIALISSHWSNYDNELRRLLNTVHNFDQGGVYLRNELQSPHERPIVVVGSGPSIDKRIAGLKSVRDKVVIVSAGTGLRPLLMAGITPDFHIELDPDYVVFKFLNDLDAEALKEITLLAVHEVNPLVARMFRNVHYYFKTDHYLPRLVDAQGQAFSHCNPTCTNAALSIAFSLGFRRIFLFGTDYGFEDPDKDHSEQSVYGDKATTDFSQSIQQRRKVKRRQEFEIPAVQGGTLLTISGYYAAKRAVEMFVEAAQGESGLLTVVNCSDGAVIEGAPWMAEDDFVSQLANAPSLEPGEVHQPFDQLSAPLPSDDLLTQLPALDKEIRTRAKEFSKLMREARLGGRKDLTLLANRLRLAVTSITPPKGMNSPTPIQLYGYQLIGGTLLHFIYAGLCHGMACSDDELSSYLKTWKQGFLDFLVRLPEHFNKVITGRRGLAEDPWVNTQLIDPEPEIED